MRERACTWTLHQSLNDHLLATNGAAEYVRELHALEYRERVAQHNPQSTDNLSDVRTGGCEDYLG
jgi:hypothetical protein